MNRREARALARSAVRRGDATGHETRVARNHFSKGIRAAEKERLEAERAKSAEDLGLVIAKQKIWTPEEGS